MTAKLIKAGIFTLCLILLNGIVFAESDYLRLVSPKNGWSSSRVITVKGETSLKIPWIYVIWNGVPLPFPVVNGVFERRLVASPGLNQIYVEADNGKTVLKDSVAFYSKAMAKPVKIILVWDTDGTHVDLWVSEPGGETCKWNYQQTKNGGNMDIGTDYPGFGPQIYTFAGIPKGQFKLQVHYYSSAGKPQTTAKVYVITNEGGPREKISEYELMLTIPGQIVALDSLNF